MCYCEILIWTEATADSVQQVSHAMECSLVPIAFPC